MPPNFAHSGGDNVHFGDFQLLKSHLTEVAELAEQLAKAALPDDDDFARATATAGLLHDLGKYQLAWQKYLIASSRQAWKGRPVPHAIHGAAYAFARLRHPPIALAVAGHHSGLDDWHALQNGLEDGSKVTAEILDQLVRDSQNDRLELPLGLVSPDWFEQAEAEHRLEFWTRVLFSVLVDADRLNTEKFSSGRSRTPVSLDSANLLDVLDTKRPLPKAGSSDRLNDLRNRVYDVCKRAGCSGRGFYQLTVPTGGGKTRSGMAFALAHATANGLRRVFVVIPYLSIIEQNAREYRTLFGTDVVLEHHSAVVAETANAGDAYKSKSPAELAAENWDAPIVVTTTVQFLESLLAASPRRCRRLHNVARSVIIFDEAQCLPTHLLNPLLDVFRDLVANWHCSVVFSTATQPAFRFSPIGLTHGLSDDELKPILDENLEAELFHDLQRVSLRNETAAPWSLDELIRRLLEAPGQQALCVLNTRRQAREVWEKLRDAVRTRFGEATSTGVRHLSSAMCAEHRTVLLGKRNDIRRGTVYQRLRDGEPCWLVSTQVIECGVDVSFPQGYRALGPLDSIVQVAGRVNREGEWPGRGDLFIFRPEDQSLPPGIYQTATAETMTILGEVEPDQLLTDPEVFARYFAILYNRADTDGGDIQRMRSEFKFDAVAKAARVIEDGGRSVIVPYGSATKWVKRIRRQGEYGRRELRRLQRYTVNLREFEFARARNVGLAVPLIPDSESVPWVLKQGSYDDNLGVVLEGLTPEQTII